MPDRIRVTVPAIPRSSTRMFRVTGSFTCAFLVFMMRVKRSFREDEVVEVIMTRSLAIFKDFLLSSLRFLLKNMIPVARFYGKLSG